MMQYYYSALFLLFLCEFEKCDSNQPKKDSDFDVLVFSQQWPNTECSLWKRKNSNNKCNMPKNPNIFIVNGFWPLKKGTKGPSSCDDNDKFDRNEVKSLIDDLKNRWTDLREDTDALWALEWKRHGTCARSLYSMKDYFKTALGLNLKYKIYDVLKEAGISPRAEVYKSSDFLNAIKKAYGKEPRVTCQTISDETVLFEIRLCFDKSLRLMDCSAAGLKKVSCKNENSIKYPDHVL